jgi:signal transduction histidine kinase
MVVHELQIHKNIRNHNEVFWFSFLVHSKLIASSNILFRSSKSFSFINIFTIGLDYSRQSQLLMGRRIGSLYEFIESATYSNKETTVISYISLFERLWQQVELYKKVIESENAGNEFISIAAHELRNPIQPILGLAEVVRDKSMDSEQKQILDIITRNARKLKSLSDNILEVSRAEKNSLRLSIEEIDIVKLILDNLQEYQNYIASIGKKINIEFENNFGWINR